MDLEDLDLVELPSVFAGRTATKYSGPRENVGGRFRSAGVITFNEDEEGRVVERNNSHLARPRAAPVSPDEPCCTYTYTPLDGAASRSRTSPASSLSTPQWFGSGSIS